jgi:hypothetical protein
MPLPAPAPVTIAAGVGQTVQIHARGRILGAAVRTGTGWVINTGSRQLDVPTLDAALSALGVLPDHHRARR